MRKGVSNGRRVVAAVAVSMVTLLAMGTGADAAITKVSVKEYAARANASVLDVSLKLPSALDDVLGAAKLSSDIQESIAFSRALGQVDSKLGNTGHGLGQMFDGDLDAALETVLKPLGKKLPKAFAPLSNIERIVHEELASISIPDAATELVKVGVSEVNASSTLRRLADGTNAVKSVSDSKLLGVTVGLTPNLVDTLKGVLQPVLDITDAPDTGLVDTINGLLTPVEGVVEQVTGVPVSLDLPKIEELLSMPLVSIGLIETRTVTDFATGARNAQGFSRMADIDLFGKGENALVHIDALTTRTFAQVAENAANRKANAIHEIVGLRVLDNEISLLKGDKLALVVNGKELALDALGGINVDELLAPLNELLFDTLGLKINVLGTTKKVTETESVASARTLEVGIAPNIAGNVLFDLKIVGPGSDVVATAGTGIQGVKTPHPTTGVATNMYLLAGPALIGAAVLVRRFVLAK